MPRRGVSNVESLYKKHNVGCAHRHGDPTRCDCPWYGKYKGIYKGLANWCGQSVDPRRKEHAKVVLNRLKTAIDKRAYNSEGEEQSQGSGQRFSDFVQEWKTHYAEEYGLTSTSLDPKGQKHARTKRARCLQSSYATSSFARRRLRG